MATRPIDSDFVFELPGVSEPAIRPDGAAVAYVRSQADRETMEVRSGIELTPFGSGRARAVTVGPADRRPLWSPDGATLAFLRSEREDGALAPAQLWLLPADGGEARRLTSLRGGVQSMSWAPDGAYLVCVSDVDPHPPPADGGRDVPRVREVRGVYYRADTLGWRGDTHRQLFRVDVAGGETRRLTRGDYDHATPAVSPDGETIAFVSSDRSATRNRKRRGGELCLMPAGGGTVTRLVRRLNIERPAWASDGSAIAFVGSDLMKRPQSFLHVFDLDGAVEGAAADAAEGAVGGALAAGPLRRITDDRISPQGGFFPIAEGPPLRWANRRLLFVADSRAASGIYSVTPSGRGLRAERDAREVIAGFSPTPDGSRCAFLSTSPRRPSELTTLDLRSGRARQRTRVSAGYIGAHPPGKVERFTVRRDGLEIDCWLLFPPDFDPAARNRRRYPLVLEIHGGPNSAFMAGFNPLHQVIAGAGAIVLLTNPRGSTTYGADFSSRVLGDWGGEDYLDLMVAVDAVCRRPYVDERRLGVHGYSYGGYMSSWIVGHTNRFKAAVVGAPVTNLLSMYGTTDIGVTFGEDQWGGRPPRNLEWYLERSPLSYADRVETPVLLLHGEADIRCPIGQSEEYFVALKRQGKQVEFVRFPDCSHLFLRTGHPALRKQYYDRVAGWFKRWL